MNVSSQTLGELVAQLAALRGLRGCAIVEADNGLVWTAQGELADRDALWEAATDFWRLQLRHAAHFAELGKFGAAVMHHHDGMLAIFSCCRDPDLLFVAVGRQGAVDWLGLQRKAAEIGHIVKDRGPIPRSSTTA